MYYVNEGQFGEKDFAFEYPLKHTQFPTLWSFKHCNLPITGVGPNGVKIVSLNRYVDQNIVPIVKEEIEQATSVRYNHLVQNGIFPKEINGQRCADSYLANLNKYWPNYNLDQFDKKRDIKMHIQERFGITKKWEGIAMFRNYTADYFDKSKPSSWLPWVEKECPTLVRLAESLPFEHIGYVIAFKSQPDTDVFIHRDFYPCNHDVNFINIQLDMKPRPFFLYDPNTKEKYYLKDNTYAYWFNETDLHGVDAESESRITLRIEGKFKDSFKKELGMRGSKTFDWSYITPREFVDSGKFYIEQSTDI